MESSEPYTGQPFIGIQTTLYLKDRGIRTYCLLNPTQGSKLGGMDAISMEASPDHPFFGGIRGLARTVVQNYGADYEDKTTFNPPNPRRLGSDQNGWCNIVYEPLSPDERREFERAIDQWINLSL